MKTIISKNFWGSLLGKTARKLRENFAKASSQGSFEVSIKNHVIFGSPGAGITVMNVELKNVPTASVCEALFLSI